VAKRISEETQLFICRRLAEYAKVPDVLAELREQGIELTPQNIHKNYLRAEKWAPVILQMRQQYLTCYLEVPIARKVERLKMLQEAYDTARRDGHMGAALAALRQAHDETTDVPRGTEGVGLSSPGVDETQLTDIDGQIDKAIEDLIGGSDGAH
jgi:hypothetical protein